MRQGKLLILCGYVFCGFLLLKVILDHVKINIHLPRERREIEDISRENSAEVTGEDDRHNDNVTHCPQILRQHFLEKQCSKDLPSLAELSGNKKKLAFMLVDDRLKIIYCAIPKTGTTSWKTFLVRVAGAEPLNHQVEDETYISQFGLRYLDKYTQQDIALRLDTYFKFMFVRHPLERLVSAYRDKIARFSSYGEEIKREIVQRIVSLRDHAARDPKYTRITFSDFVKYVLLKYSEGANFDHHWERYAEVCHPCVMNYDYIGKLETINTDAENIISKFQSTRTRFQAMESLNKKFSYSKVQLDNYRTILKDFGNVTKEDLGKILDIYDKDMTGFGYSFNGVSGVASCASKAHGYKCC